MRTLRYIERKVATFNFGTDIGYRLRLTFSDGTVVERSVKLPAGARADNANDRHWVWRAILHRIRHPVRYRWRNAKHRVLDHVIRFRHGTIRVGNRWFNLPWLKQ